MRSFQPPRAAVFPLVVAVLAGGALALRDGDTDETAPTVLGWRPAQVHRLVVESHGQRVEFTRRGTGDWRAAPGTPPQSATLLLGFEDQLLPVLAYRAVQVDPTDPQFGLAEPTPSTRGVRAEVIVAVEDTRGAQRRLLLGAPTFTGGGFYARVIGNETSDPDPAEQATPVYLVARRTMDNLRSLLAGQPVTSADPLQDKATQLERERAQAQEQAGMTPWLAQVLNAGVQPPAGGERRE